MIARNILAGLALSLVASAAAAEDLRFVALGDAPYGKAEVVYPQYEALIATINAVSPDLVIHVGDTKSGKTECSNVVLDQQLAYLDSFTAPTMYTPGDNEWTDCHRKKAGKFDPLERLKRIRSTYFDTPDTTFGKTKYALENQSAKGYPENARFQLRGVMFMTAHVVGSNNNLEARSLAATTEFFKRDAANIAWLKDGFAAATRDNADALVLAIHADMFEFDWNEGRKRKWLRHSGFTNFGKALRKAASEFGKPVLLVFGDSHRHRVFKPFPKKAANVTALEVFGAKEMHAVEVTARRTGAEIRFDIQPLLNPAL